MSWILPCHCANATDNEVDESRDCRAPSEGAGGGDVLAMRFGAKAGCSPTLRQCSADSTAQCDGTGQHRGSLATLAQLSPLFAAPQSDRARP